MQYSFYPFAVTSKCTRTSAFTGRYDMKSCLLNDSVCADQSELKSNELLNVIILYKKKIDGQNGLVPASQEDEWISFSSALQDDFTH